MYLKKIINTLNCIQKQVGSQCSSHMYKYRLAQKHVGHGILNQLPDILQVQSCVKHIIVVQMGGNQSMSDCEKGTLIQE